MIRPIYLYGSEVLRQVAAPADLSDREYLDNLVTDLKETLAKAEGCGLAAPQIGESVRVLIVDGRDMADVYPYLEGFTRVMINPVIIEESDRKSEYSEGCLSIPGIYYDVVRPESMTVEYYNEKLEKVTEKFWYEISYLICGLPVKIDIIDPAYVICVECSHILLDFRGVPCKNLTSGYSDKLL